MNNFNADIKAIHLSNVTNDDEMEELIMGNHELEFFHTTGKNSLVNIKEIFKEKADVIFDSGEFVDTLNELVKQGFTHLIL